MGFINWDEVPVQERGPGRTARVVLGEKTTVALMNHEGPCGHELHRHEGMEQVTYVLEGQVEFTIENEKKILRSGDAVVVPPGVLHGTRVEAGEKAISFEVFSTPRPEMLPRA